jgi:DUF971 family protein
MTRRREQSETVAEASEPQSIRQAGPRDLEIVWKDGRRSVFDVVFLRRACRCALCVEEWTGAQVLRPEQVSEDVRPLSVEPVGRYALQIRWSDGHQSGIYAFDYLRRLDAELPGEKAREST